MLNFYWLHSTYTAWIWTRMSYHRMSIPKESTWLKLALFDIDHIHVCHCCWKHCLRLHFGWHCVKWSMRIHCSVNRQHWPIWPHHSMSRCQPPPPILDQNQKPKNPKSCLKPAPYSKRFSCNFGFGLWCSLCSSFPCTAKIWPFSVSFTWDCFWYSWWHSRWVLLSINKVELVYTCHFETHEMTRNGVILR